MKTVQDFAFRQARRKLPLPILPDLCGIEPAAGVAEGPALGIMEADGDAPREEPRAMVGAGLKAAGRLGPDPLLREQGGVGIEPQCSRV